MNRASERTGVVVDRDRFRLRWLESALGEAGVVVVARSTSLAHVSALVLEHRPDLLAVGSDESLDESAHRLDLGELRASCPALRLVVVSAAADAGAIEAAFGAGADAFCLGTTPADDLVTVIRQVFDRSIYLPPSVGGGHGTARCARAPHDPRRLTRRELEVLGLVAEGRSNPEVARMLWLTEQTVKFHLRNVFRKLDVANRSEASDWAHSHHVSASCAAPLPAARRDESRAVVVAPRAPSRPRPRFRSMRREPSCRAFRTRGL
jgi:DNA-binding NarL/FixJ family response regulator